MLSLVPKTTLAFATGLCRCVTSTGSPSKSGFLGRRPRPRSSRTRRAYRANSPSRLLPRPLSESDPHCIVTGRDHRCHEGSRIRTSSEEFIAEVRKGRKALCVIRQTGIRQRQQAVHPVFWKLVSQPAHIVQSERRRIEKARYQSLSTEIHPRFVPEPPTCQDTVLFAP